MCGSLTAMAIILSTGHEKIFYGKHFFYFDNLKKYFIRVF